MHDEPTILVADDECGARFALRDRLADRGYRVLEAENGAGVLTRVGEVDLVLLNSNLPDVTGHTVIGRIKRQAPGVPVIMLTGHPSIENAVEYIKAGAYHCLDTQILDSESVLEWVARALERRAMESRGLEGVIGESPAMREVKVLIERVATSTATTALLVGESGTGKDRAARAIHELSARATRPFMNITCSALPEELLESELFGHERGAFTDAKTMRRGLFELGNGGTIFLDEIGEMSARIQAKLLRFLDSKQFVRVGGSDDIQLDARILAATNRDLAAAVADKSFREDLYYRLNVVTIRLPPLRERGDDVLLLADSLLAEISAKLAKPCVIGEAAKELLLRYPWPGNVRELRNALERAALLAVDEVLEPEDFRLREEVLAPVQPFVRFRLPEEGIDFEAFERTLVTEALERTGGNSARAGRYLGMNRDQMRYRIKKFGLDAKAH
ncbi:MAG: sigma-54-dependent Fis family transcriptional regulator [Deltaproteobacteria bacterium]|nr:sigma-54-dependent Fis family transcriptional regulator [Deltaproteobacteria bacterium]